MKSQNIAKINPIIEIASPTLIQCKMGECGDCPTGTGKLLWVVNPNNTNTAFSRTFTFVYNFFNKSAESTSIIKHNICDNTTTINGQVPSYSNPPNKAWSVANEAVSLGLTPSSMKTFPFQSITFSFNGLGGWIFFRQPNPAISNVHDALCFEYNREKNLITFRSF